MLIVVPFLSYLVYPIMHCEPVVPDQAVSPIIHCIHAQETQCTLIINNVVVR